MPTLDLKQITDKLNAEFASDTRKIVFWYDEAAEFTEDIDTLELHGAKLHKLTTANQFYTKYLLERQDTESSYLVYAPFSKPNVRENALEDTLLYSRRFYADRVSLLMVDLGIDENYKHIIQKYIKFFAAKDRTQRFYDFELDNFTKDSIETALMSALCKARVPSLEEVLRVVLTEGGLEDNPYLTEFEKYGLLQAFWQQCENTLGYIDDMPSPARLASTLFVSYTSKQLRGDVPMAWKGFVSYKSGSIIAFMDNLKNSTLYRARYDELSAHIASVLNVSETLENTDLEAMLECDTFDIFDSVVLKWITERLINEDIGASLNGLNILALCEQRRKKHFGVKYSLFYEMLEAAFGIICVAQYTCSERYEDILDKYIKTDYLIDSHYRLFYTAYDRLADTEDYEKLRSMIENIYTNKYLAKLLPAWSAVLNTKAVMLSEHAQLRFFDKYVRYAKDKTAIIISDALRYEVGRELFEKLNDDPNCNVDIGYQISVLPSYTQLGMAVLLPYKSLKLTADGKVLVDGQPSDSTERRETILRTALPDSRCIRADNLPSKRDDLREIFNAMDAVYIYHDQIDAHGGKAATENEVFTACSEAVKEIYKLIKKLSVSANVYRFVVTADHGFLYKRDKFNESDKIALEGQKDAFLSRRFIIAENALSMDGVASAPLADVLGCIGGDETRVISWPVSANVFKTQGGLNYVHGGASPQEMILPLISVKMEKGHVDTYPAKIALVSMIQKITNMFTQLEFIQQEPVSYVVKAASYKLYFLSEDNEKISNEQLYQADKKDSNPSKRMFRLRFNFKNKKYDRSKQYWLVAVDAGNGMELFRHQVVMDIAFSDDIGFD